MKVPCGFGSSVLEQLAAEAWRVRDSARVLGPTKVGCAALEEQGRVFAGCNIEHKWRSHDIHAEVNAIGSLVAAGGRRLVAILLAAEHTNFTPCGSCLDWIFAVGGEDCYVYCQTHPSGPLNCYAAVELMPHHPSLASQGSS
jgi:cytidine deaminase